MKQPNLTTFSWDQRTAESLRDYMIVKGFFPTSNTAPEKQIKHHRANLARIIEHLSPADLQALSEIARLLYVSRDQAEDCVTWTKIREAEFIADYLKSQNGGGE